jgi:hypothetical protein
VHLHNLQWIEMLDQLNDPISPIQINPVYWKLSTDHVITGGPHQPDSIFGTGLRAPWP